MTNTDTFDAASSNNIATVSWGDLDPGSVEPSTRILDVTFRNGRTYRYYNVEREIFEALKRAEESGESVGRLFNDLVRNAGTGAEEITGR